MFTYNVLMNLDCYRMQRMATEIIREKIDDIKWTKFASLEASCKLPWKSGNIVSELVLDGKLMRMFLEVEVEVDPSRWFNRERELTESEKIGIEVNYYLELISDYVDGSNWSVNCYDIEDEVMTITCVNPITYTKSTELAKQIDSILWGPEDHE